MSLYEGHMTPQLYAQRIAQMLLDAQQECRITTQQITDTQAQAMFESIATMLGGAIRTLDEYRGVGEHAQGVRVGGEYDVQQSMQRTPTGSLPDLTRIPTGNLLQATRTSSGGFVQSLRPERATHADATEDSSDQM